MEVYDPLCGRLFKNGKSGLFICLTASRNSSRFLFQFWMKLLMNVGDPVSLTVGPAGYWAKLFWGHSKYLGLYFQCRRNTVDVVLSVANFIF